MEFRRIPLCEWHSGDEVREVIPPYRLIRKGVSVGFTTLLEAEMLQQAYDELRSRFESPR